MKVVKAVNLKELKWKILMKKVLVVFFIIIFLLM